MKRRLTFTIEFNSLVGRKQISMEHINNALANLVSEMTDGLDEKVEISMYVRTTKDSD